MKATIKIQKQTNVWGNYPTVGEFMPAFDKQRGFIIS